MTLTFAQAKKQYLTIKEGLKRSHREVVLIKTDRDPTALFRPSKNEWQDDEYRKAGSQCNAGMNQHKSHAAWGIYLDMVDGHKDVSGWTAEQVSQLVYGTSTP